MKSSKWSVYLTIGLMLFALFFGAGNLIFPALLGGVIAIAYTGAKDAESIARPVSKGYALLFSIALYLSIGPFFAIPRTGATSYSLEFLTGWRFVQVRWQIVLENT